MVSPLGEWPAWREKFLETFRATCNVRLSAQAVGIDRATAFHRRKMDEAFAAEWAAAKEDAVDVLEAEARRRALSGSDWLLWRMLQAHRRDVYGDSIRVDVRRETERIAAELGMSDDEITAAVAEVERILSTASGEGDT